MLSCRCSLRQTNVQNILDVWVSKDLPGLSVSIARSVVLDEISRVLNIDDSEHTYAALAEHIKALPPPRASS